MRILPVVLLAFLGGRAFCQKQVLPDYQADPSAHVWQGTTWIYPSHDLPNSQDWAMTDWHAFSSKDLKTWKDEGVIFSLDSITWAKKWAWAPDAAFRNGTYYFYFPADGMIGVATAKTPKGPFKDALGKPLIGKNESGTFVIDPCVFQDTDGQAYLYFGQNNSRVVKLKDDMVTREGDIINMDVANFHEGSWMHKKGDWYYLSYCSREAESVEMPEYPGGAPKKVKYNSRIAYSVSKSPLGPWQYKGVIIDNYSRNNHHSIVEIKKKWYLFYHVQGPSFFERRVCMEPLRFRPDGTIVPIDLPNTGLRKVAAVK